MRRRNCPSEHRLLSGASSCASPIEAVPTADRTLRSTAVEKGPTLTLHWIRLPGFHPWIPLYRMVLDPSFYVLLALWYIGAALFVAIGLGRRASPGRRSRE